MDQAGGSVGTGGVNVGGSFVGGGSVGGVPGVFVGGRGSGVITTLVAVGGGGGWGVGVGCGGVGVRGTAACGTQTCCPTLRRSFFKQLT